MKARVDLERTESEPRHEVERYARARVPQETGLAHAAEPFAKWAEEGEPEAEAG